jgi:hypothetical protein
LIAQEFPKEWPPIKIMQSLEELHAVVRRTGARIGARSQLTSGLLESRGDDVLEVRASEAHKLRALIVVDAVLRAALASGASLDEGSCK